MSRSTEATKYDLDATEKAAIAAEQIAQFKRELFHHELNLVRLQALPTTGPAEQDAASKARAAIATLQSAIDATEAHVA